MKYTRNMIGAATFASFLLAGSAYADVCDTPSKLKLWCLPKQPADKVDQHLDDLLNFVIMLTKFRR